MVDLASLDSLIQRCESEQLHLSGAIQGFGALVVIDRASKVITHVSVNLRDFLGLDPETVLGRPSGDFSWLADVDLRFDTDRPGSRIPLLRQPHGQDQVTGVAILGTGSILVELERIYPADRPIPVQQLQAPLLVAPYDEDEVTQHHRTLLSALKTITGFHRLMIYRFAEDWSGEVIAERTDEGMGSYLGLNFPASDIPAIARNLYVQNPLRMIPDAKAGSVPIVGLTASPPDLTWSDLRSVSPVHLEYLDHMGVGASFSIPIRITGRLWGLVACHHLDAHMLSTDQRLGCVSLVNAYSLGLTSHFAGRRIQALDSLERRITNILEALTQYDDPLDGIDQMHGALMDIMNAQGFAMAVGGNVVIAGEAPDLDGMGIVDDWFLNDCSEMIVVTDHLEDIYPGQLAVLAVVSGMIAIKARSIRSGWVRFYWFRPAHLQEVAWAGNPDKPVVEKAGALMLSPRRSFEKWIEVKSGYSRPWNNDEKMTAAKFRTTLLQWL